ncbi:MAG: DUF7146 domain-containing protein [Planktomarina sp.]
MTEARQIIEALGGDHMAGYGLAPCPICQPEGRRDQRGLSVKDAGGKTLLTCHKSGCPAPDIFKVLHDAGIVERGGKGSYTPPSADQRKAERESRQERAAKTAKFCNDLWAQSKPIMGSVAQNYLENVRGLKGAQWAKMERTLRFHPNLKHTPSAGHFPAILARVRGPNGKAMGLHRTYLAPDGSGKANVQGGSAKMMLGSCARGAVRFGKDREIMALAEGIETALSIGLSGRMTVWATLSTSGMKAVEMPPLPMAAVVIIAADNDPAGLAAAQQTATRLEGEGRTVSIIHPPRAGQDFNDVLMGV